MTTLKTVLQTVAAYYRIPVRDLRGATRRREIAYARHVAMYLARQHTRSSLRTIGEWLDWRSNAAVMYGIKRIREMLKTDVNGIQAEIKELSKKLDDSTSQS